MDEFWHLLGKQLTTLGPIGILVIILYALWLRTGAGMHRENSQRLDALDRHEEVEAKLLQNLIDKVGRIESMIDELISVYKRRR